MAVTKVTTCCYCGARAALVLTGSARHELACATCGAPISRMKMLPSDPVRATAPAATPTRPEPEKRRVSSHERAVGKGKKRKKSKSFRRKLWGEVWDVIEDIFD